MNLLKNKRFIIVACAIVFLCIIFFSKTGININKKNKTGLTLETGLTYDSSETIQNLVNKDTDGDGIFDWEEGLWGTDPTKKDTDDDGTRDDIEISKLKKEKMAKGETEIQETDEKKLTQTDKFSQEFFSTVATLNQAGGVDDATVEKLGSSLADQIKNSASKKVYTMANIKISATDDKKAVQSYSNNLDTIYKKYPIKKSVTTVLQEFLVDENIEVLTELDPITNQMDKIINELVKVNTPRSLSVLHLELINDFERLMENVSDIKLLDNDTIVALSAVSQYEKNVEALEKTLTDLTDTISKKLNN